MKFLLTMFALVLALHAPVAVAEEMVAAPPAPASAKTAEEVLASQNLQIEFGKKDAPVEVIEYFSLSCPHCADFYKHTQPKLIKEYVETNKVHYIMRYFPHNGPGMAATMLMQCVADEKKQQFLDALFNMQDKWAFTNDFKKKLQTISEIGGISPVDFDTCLSDKAMEERVLTQRKDTMDVLKINGIPSVFVNGKLLEGFDYDRIRQRIEEELKAAQE